MDGLRRKISVDLLPVLDWALSQGNKVLRVDEPAGTTCPLAVVLTGVVRGTRSTVLPLSALTEKDRSDLAFALDLFAGQFIQIVGRIND